MKLKSTLTVALSLMIVSGAANAARIVADPPHDFEQQTVFLGDLDLADASGAREAYRRLETAARDVCDATRTRIPLSQKMVQRECVEQALSNAVDSVDSRELARIHGV